MPAHVTIVSHSRCSSKHNTTDWPLLPLLDKTKQGTKLCFTSLCLASFLQVRGVGESSRGSRHSWPWRRRGSLWLELPLTCHSITYRVCRWMPGVFWLMSCTSNCTRNCLSVRLCVCTSVICNTDVRGPPNLYNWQNLLPLASLEFGLMV